MKKIFSFFIVLIFAATLLISCSKEASLPDPDKYQEYNETIENYFLARVEEDYYTMKQYLSENQIKNEPNIINAKKEDKPQNIDRKEKMGDKYSIKGFDYFYEDHNVIYYFIEYYNYMKNGTTRYIYGVTKDDNGKIKVFNIYGFGGIGGNYVKEVYNEANGYFTIDGLKESMEKYPEHTFVVKDYPET